MLYTTLNTISTHVFQLDCADTGNLDKRYFDCHKSAAMSPSFTNQREVGLLSTEYYI